MTAAAEHILRDFASLSDSEKREVLATLLAVSREIDYPQMQEEELISSADALFLTYDRLEEGS